jgi:hypothetical protein
MAMVKSFLLLSTAFWLAACYCGGPETIQLNELENRCGSLPCGVTLVSGNASIVPTFHKGEHGIRLDKNSVMRIDSDPSKATPLLAEAQLQVLFLCDENTSFDVVMGSEDASGPTEVTLMGKASPASGTDELPVATFEIPGPNNQVLVRPQLRFLQFTTIGPGGCTLDDIWVLVAHLCQG